MQLPRPARRYGLGYAMAFGLLWCALGYSAGLYPIWAIPGGVLAWTGAYLLTVTVLDKKRGK